MKKSILLLIAVCLSLSAVSEAFAAREFKSSLFDGVSVELMEKNLSITKEESSGGTFPVKLTFALDGRDKDTQIVAYFTLKEEYMNYVTVTLPEKVFRQWNKYYDKQFTETKISFMPAEQELMSAEEYDDADDPQLLYFAYSVSGKYKGNWLINYFGVVYGVHIQVTGQAAEFDQESAWSVFSAYTSCVDYALGVIQALSGE